MDGFFDAVTTEADGATTIPTETDILTTDAPQNTSIVMGMSGIPPSNNNDLNNDEIAPTAVTDSMNNNLQSQYSASKVDTNPYESQTQPSQNTETIDIPPQTSADIFAGLGGDAENETEDEKDINADKTDDEPTFLSVWTDQRRNELEDRRRTENDSQQKSVSTAQETLEEFYAERNARIAAKQKENRMKEEQLREDLQSTFEHGTIWEQVGKMVSLQESDSKSKSSDRMRVLLIHLKNAKK